MPNSSHILSSRTMLCLEHTHTQLKIIRHFKALVLSNISRFKRHLLPWQKASKRGDMSRKSTNADTPPRMRRCRHPVYFRTALRLSDSRYFILFPLFVPSHDPRWVKRVSRCNVFDSPKSNGYKKNILSNDLMITNLNIEVVQLCFKILEEENLGKV